MTDSRTREKSPRSREQRRPVRNADTWLVVAAFAFGMFQLLALPILVHTHSRAWGWTLVPLALLTTPFWSLIHEAIHGSLLTDRELNDRCGRALAVLYGAPFTMLKAGHLLHHRYSRTRERTEIYDPATSTWMRTAPGYYLRLLGGLYLLEVAAVLLALLPAAALRRAGRRLDTPESVAGPLFDRLADPRSLGRFRTDAAAIVALYAAAFLAYGHHAWMLAAAIGARALIISISDNAYHYGTELDAPLDAMNLRLPRPLERFALNFTLHGVHHRHPGLRWYELREKFLAEGGAYSLNWTTAAVRQLRGPIELP
ncbi:fatty acid desaturase [Nocardia jejuensis]|uniref:fatty acid desaturase n=1 Tax=Nocardia jejuensis TaxID=328049 RepID=UPI00082F3321|nr:fatty acid desaturase [Nocardia jejuensis]